MWQFDFRSTNEYSWQSWVFLDTARIFQPHSSDVSVAQGPVNMSKSLGIKVSILKHLYSKETPVNTFCNVPMLSNLMQHQTSPVLKIDIHQRCISSEWFCFLTDIELKQKMTDIIIINYCLYWVTVYQTFSVYLSQNRWWTQAIAFRAPRDSGTLWIHFFFQTFFLLKSEIVGIRLTV